MIKGIQFGVLAQDEIPQLSVVEVDDYTLHHRATGRPGSLLDPRLGATNRFQPCETCGKSIMLCPSHPGHTVLPLPLPHVAFKTTVLQLLNCICCNCSALLATDSQRSAVAAVEDPAKRLPKLFTMLRSRRQHGLFCSKCEWSQPITILNEPYFVQQWPPDDSDKEKPRLRFNNLDAVYLLQSVSHADLQLLGFCPEFSHPSDLLLRYLLIPGAAVRPTLHQSEGSKRQTYNELTKVLASILKYVAHIKSKMEDTGFNPEEMDNNALAEGRPAGPGWTADLDCQIKALYANISAYFYPKQANIANFRMRPYDAKLHAMKNSSLIAPLQGGKFGRYRQHLMGKRVNFCIRTVVTPFPEGDADQIGIPEELARIVTVPVRVTRLNIHVLQRKVQTPDQVRHVIVDPTQDDMIEVNNNNRMRIQLSVGHIVERVLEDDDYVIVNRQPTLHRSSEMAHRVKVVQGKTVRLNMTVATPYNCDCDGDELNIHVVQSVEAAAELEELMSVHNNIMHPGANKPVFGLIQDDVAAVFMLTSADTWLTRADVMELLMQTEYDPHADPTLGMKNEPSTHKLWTGADLPPPALSVRDPHTGQWTHRWSGKQLFGMLMPDVSYFRHNKGNSDDVIVNHGQLLSGQLCKKTMGPVPHGLMHNIALYLGYGGACRFLSDVQRVTNHYFARTGFSIGLDDCFPDPAAQPKLKHMVSDIYEHVAKIEAQVAAIRALSDESNLDEQQYIAELHDVAIVDTVKQTLDTAGAIVTAHLPRHNAIRVMTCDAQSKGSVFNAAQIMGALGQTFVDGDRPGKGTRFLPSSPLLFNKKSDGNNKELIQRMLQSRGFIERPYAAGLNVEQVFMHSMGGREGLIDTARKTKTTGYLQRRLVKALESLTVQPDNTVRNARGSVFALRSGGDGYEATRVFALNKLDLLTADDATLYGDDNESNTNDDRRFFTPRELIHARDELRRHRMHGLQSDITALSVQAMSPFNLETLVPPEGSVVTLQCRCYNRYEPVPAEVLHAVREFVFGQLGLPVQAHVMFMFEHRLRYCTTCIDWLVQEMARLHRMAQVQPGECIGALTATSLGEPSTQLTLNTFHLAGVANAGMTYGIPRLCELVDATKANAIRSPCIIATLQSGVTRDVAESVAASLAEVALLDKLQHSQVCRMLPASVVETNPALFALADINSRFLRFHVRLDVAPEVNVAHLVQCVQESVGDRGLILTDRAAPASVFVLIVDDPKMFAKTLKRAVTPRIVKANKKTARPFSLPPDAATDLDMRINMPMDLLCPDMTDPPTATDVVHFNIAREFRARLLTTCILQGHRGITSAKVRTMRFSRVSAGGALVTDDRLVIDVRGTGLRFVHEIPHIDLSQVVSNNVREVYETLGIDAAAHVLFHEIRTCFEVGGTRTDDRLISLLVDFITHWGFILPITRHGINRLRDQSIVAKITFEEVLDMLFAAASTGQYDPLLGPSEVIMVGKRISGGTGMSEMVTQTLGNNADDDADDPVVVSVLPECSGFLPPQTQTKQDPQQQHQHQQQQQQQQQHVFPQPLTSDNALAPDTLAPPNEQMFCPSSPFHGVDW